MQLPSFVGIVCGKQHDVVASNKASLAILRVTDASGDDLDAATLDRVAVYAKNWNGIAYTEAGKVTGACSIWPDDRHSAYGSLCSV